jgi:hypothetical protein
MRSPYRLTIASRLQAGVLTIMRAKGSKSLAIPRSLTQLAPPAAYGGIDPGRLHRDISETAIRDLPARPVPRATSVQYSH